MKNVLKIVILLSILFHGACLSFAAQHSARVEGGWFKSQESALSDAKWNALLKVGNIYRINGTVLSAKGGKWKVALDISWDD